MTSKIILNKKEKDRADLLIPVHPNFHEGWVSKNGNSWAYRVVGERIKANGKVSGNNNEVSGVITESIPQLKDNQWRVADYLLKKTFSKEDTFKAVINDLIHLAIKIPVIKVK